MLIIWIVTILALITVAQLMRVSAIAKKIHNKREEDISDADNSFNGTFLLFFVFLLIGSTIYLIAKYGNGLLPEAASEHGVEIDWLFDINWIIILSVFALTNALLFVIAFKYRGRAGRKAYYFTHDNKLELVWTVAPAIVLAVIIILGLRTWNHVTGKVSEDAQIVEVYGYQFNWLVRYSGEDNKLGFADYKLVTTENPLGVASPEAIEASTESMTKIINEIDASIKADSAGLEVYTVEEMHEMQSRMDKFIRLREKVQKMKTQYKDSDLSVGDDDFVSQIELHLVKGQNYQFIFRSKDVLHSAYFPHFRAQMNAVPGMRTKFAFKPTISTAEMREIRGDENFNYVLMCNKICGESHSNMKMIVVVDETQEEFDEWASENTKTAVAKK